MKAAAGVLLALRAVSTLAQSPLDDEDVPLEVPPLESPAVKASVERPLFVPSTGRAVFIEQFQQDVFARWSPSEATKQTPVGGETFSYVGKWAVREPDVFPGIKGDKGLVVTNPAAHHAISVPLTTPVDPATEPLVVQYEVKLQNGLECGGAYIKLLSESPDGIQAEEFSDKTPYTIMFGPDRCGATNKVHLILRHKNPVTGEIEEKHLKNAPSPKISKTTTLYTLILDPSKQTYEIKVDDQSVKTGSLLEDFDPPVNPPAEIDDPDDKKPEDWVEQAKITDPDATKPDDWDEDAPMEIEDADAEIPDGWLEDEPPTVPDPEAEKPEEWDDEEDGDWVPPTVPNPKCEDAPGCGPWIRPMKSNPSYKGKWYAPLIDNPLFKGIWKPRLIANPGYFKDESPLSNIGRVAGLGYEIWSMQAEILFDNVFVGNSAADAAQFAKETFHIKVPIEKAAEESEKPPPFQDSLKGAYASFRKDPLGYIRNRVENFVEAALEDPVAAFKTHPQEGAIVGGILATFLGMIGFLLGMVGSKAPVVQEKATAVAEQAKAKADEVAPAVQDTVDGAVSSATDATQTGTDNIKNRTRQAKAKAAE